MPGTKKRPSALKSGIELADELFRVIVKRAGLCGACGKRPPAVTLECAHIISRTYKSVRWHEKNAFCLCSGCHVFYTHNPIDWVAWVIEQIGADEYAELAVKATAKWDKAIDVVIARLRERTRALGLV